MVFGRLVRLGPAAAGAATQAGESNTQLAAKDLAL